MQKERNLSRESDGRRLAETLRTRRWVARVLLVAASSLAAVSAPAQLPDSQGTEFWLMFNRNRNNPSLSLFITGDTATTGTVEIPSDGFLAPFSVTPGTVTTVGLPRFSEARTSDFIGHRGVYVTADAEVTVYGINQVEFSTDAFLGLPTDILGTEYINLGYENVDVVNGTQFSLVATEDATTVTLTLAETTGGRIAGAPYSIVLDRGETYQLRNTGSAPADLSGSIIESDKPIAVFGGHECANIPAGAIACDHLVEQLPPTSTWGTAFFTFPLATRLNGDTFRILASRDRTSVAIDGTVVTTLDRGELHEEVLTSPSAITADAPILVAQYSNSQTFDNVVSDPFQVVIPPFEQFLARYTITTPATGFSVNFVNVVAPTSAAGSIVVDGVPIPAGDYTPIGSSGFSGAHVPIDLGSHHLSGPTPFGITTYGFAFTDSYGYPGGLALAEVAELDELVLAPETSTSPVGAEQCWTATARDGDQQPLRGIRIDFDVTGANSGEAFGVTDASGEAELCYVGARTGTDTITGRVGARSDTATHEWRAAAAVRCDVDANGRIDVDDIFAIMGARNTAASGPDDPRDADGNGTIDANDARQCVLRCDEARCAR